MACSLDRSRAADRSTTDIYDRVRRLLENSRTVKPRRSCLRGDDGLLGSASGDLQHQLGAGRLLELLALMNCNHERSRAPDHAILIIDVEVCVRGVAVRSLHHD